MADMLKYEGKLTRESLILFLRNFDMWVNLKNIQNERTMKAALSMAITTPIAQQWFLINNAKIEDRNINFQGFIHSRI